MLAIQPIKLEFVNSDSLSFDGSPSQNKQEYEKGFTHLQLCLVKPFHRVDYVIFDCPNEGRRRLCMRIFGHQTNNPKHKCFRYHIELDYSELVANDTQETREKYSRCGKNK